MLSNLPLTTSDIIFAAIAALFFTAFIRTFIAMNRKLKEDLNTAIPDTVESVLKKCRLIYPLDAFNFHGKTFRRGMRIKITTNQDKIFEGELIGFNQSNALCIMTSRLIVAYELQNIRDIVVIDEK